MTAKSRITKWYGAARLLAHALHPPEEPVDDHLEAGLLEHLAHDGHVEGLAHLDVAAGHRPLPCRRPLPAPDEQQRAVVHRHRAHGHAGPVMAPAQIGVGVEHGGAW